MLNFECANCGRIEMLHLGRDVIEKFVRMALWTADWEYREDPPPIPSELQTVEEVMGFLFEHEKGYRYSLEKCPGFSYRKHERAEIIDMFCRTASNMLDFLPEEWQRFSERKMKLLEKEEDKKFSGPYYPPSHVVILIDSKTGRSRVVQIE